MTPHLTPEQIDDQLIGDLAPAAAKHLAACPDCQAAVTHAGSPMADFRAVSLAWAERRSATMPSPVTAGKRVHEPLAWGALGATAVAAVVLLVVPHAYAPGSSVPSRATTAGSSSPSTASDDAQIARDNQMLAAIDDALNAPVRPAGFANRSHSRTNHLRG